MSNESDKITIAPADMPIGVNVWVSGQNLEHCLEMAFKMWVKERPREVVLFRNHMIEKKDSLSRKDGMSDMGTWKEYLEIPQSLALKVQQMTHKEWTQDRKITEMIKKVMPNYLCYEKNESTVLGGV